MQPDPAAHSRGPGVARPSARSAALPRGQQAQRTQHGPHDARSEHALGRTARPAPQAWTTSARPRCSLATPSASRPEEGGDICPALPDLWRRRRDAYRLLACASAAPLRQPPDQLSFLAFHSLANQHCRSCIGGGRPGGQDRCWSPLIARLAVPESPQHLGSRLVLSASFSCRTCKPLRPLLYDAQLGLQLDARLMATRRATPIALEPWSPASCHRFPVNFVGSSTYWCRRCIAGQVRCTAVQIGGNGRMMDARLHRHMCFPAAQGRVVGQNCSTEARMSGLGIVRRGPVSAHHAAMPHAAADRAPIRSAALGSEAVLRAPRRGRSPPQRDGLCLLRRGQRMVA